MHELAAPSSSGHCLRRQDGLGGSADVGGKEGKPKKKGKATTQSNSWAGVRKETEMVSHLPPPLRLGKTNPVFCQENIRLLGAAFD